MTGEVSLRRMESVDWEMLRAVRLEALRDSPLAFGSTYERESAMGEDEWRARAVKWCDGVGALTVLAVGEGGERGMGMGCGVVKAGEDGVRRLSVYAMWVSPEVRGRGVGRGILEKILEWGRGVGAEVAGLNVAEGNDRARRVYESMGFVMTGRGEAHPVFVGVMHLEMEKRLV